MSRIRVTATCWLGFPYRRPTTMCHGESLAFLRVFDITLLSVGPEPAEARLACYLSIRRTPAAEHFDIILRENVPRPQLPAWLRAIEHGLKFRGKERARELDAPKQTGECCGLETCQRK